MEEKMLLDDFKKTVDSYSASISNKDHKHACNELGIDTTRGYASSSVTDTLYQNVRDALQIGIAASSDKISRSKVLKLQSGLIYRHVLLGEDSVEYLKVLKVIQDSCRQNGNYFPSFTDTERWKKAIINCKNFNAFSDTHAILFGNLRDDYPKDYDIATSIKRLVERGCEIEIKDSDIYIKSGLETVVDELNNKIKTLGGLGIIRTIFYLFHQEKKYSEKFERYYITRQASGLSYDQQPQVPFGYLLNLALKYPYENPEVKNPQALYNEILELSVLISNGPYGVQHYNIWEFHFQTGETILKFCTEIALWDSMFSITQCRPSSAVEICDKLFEFIPHADFENDLGFNKQEFISVFQVLNNIPADIHIPTIFFHYEVSRKLPHINKHTIQKILDVLSQTKVNENYLLPSDYSSIDFGQKPLIKLGDTRFLLMNRSWCAPNYFEALSSPLRQKFKSQKKDLDNELGRQLELYLQKKFTGQSISFVTGNYEVDGIHGECDFLIETQKAIVLIEFKKKVLTRKSKSGNDIHILLDLSDSILSAQLQAGRTEIIFREKGSITLTDKNGNVNTVNFDNRTIERVALTQLEFGGFQDRGIINQFLKSLLTHSFGTYSSDPAIIKKFKKLNEKQKLWIDQHNKLHSLDKNFSRFPYFNCWFMSLPQLIEVVNLSSDNNSFYDNFGKTKYVTANTLDWYREFEYISGLHNVKTKQ